MAGIAEQMRAGKPSQHPDSTQNDLQEFPSRIDCFIAVLGTTLPIALWLADRRDSTCGRERCMTSPRLSLNGLAGAVAGKRSRIAAVKKKGKR